MSRPEFDPGESISREQLLAQIDTRLDVLRPLVDEYEQLARARAVLGEDNAGSAPRWSGAGHAPARPARGPRRAPRGANREAILRLAGERPGITVAELFEATGIAKPTLYSTIYALTRRGELQRAGDGIKLAGAQAPTARPARRAATARTASKRRAPSGGRAGSGRRARRAPGARRAPRARAPAARSAASAPAATGAEPEASNAEPESTPAGAAGPSGQ